MNRRLNIVDLLRLAWLIRRGDSDPVAAERALAAYGLVRDRILLEMGRDEQAGAFANVPAFLVSLADGDPAVRARARELDARAQQRGRTRWGNA